MGHCINLLLLGTLCVGGEVFASASAGEKCDVTNEDAQPLPASTKPSPFQVELDAVQAAKAAFSKDPSPDHLRAIVAPVVALFNAMHKENETHGTLFPGVDWERKMQEAHLYRAQYAVLAQPQLNAEVTRHYLPGVNPSAQSEEDALRGRVCGAYLGMVKGVPTAFALQNMAQQSVYADIITLSRKHQDMTANEAWTDLKVEASSLGVDHAFLVNFLSLPKTLQDLLFVTHGDKTHESWQPRMARVSVSAATDPAWTAIIAMDKDVLEKNLTPLIEKHQKIRDEIAARDSVSQTRKGFETFDHFNTCYNQVSSLFWAAEKALLDAIMLDKADGASENMNRFMPLLEAWSDADASEDDRIRELIVGTLDALMQKRFALTTLMQSSAVSQQKPPSPAPAPTCGRPEEEVDVCEEDQDA